MVGKTSGRTHRPTSRAASRAPSPAPAASPPSALHSSPAPAPRAAGASGGGRSVGEAAPCSRSPARSAQEAAPSPSRQLSAPAIARACSRPGVRGDPASRRPHHFRDISDYRYLDTLSIRPRGSPLLRRCERGSSGERGERGEASPWRVQAGSGRDGEAAAPPGAGAQRSPCADVRQPAYGAAAGLLPVRAHVLPQSQRPSGCCSHARLTRALLRVLAAAAGTRTSRGARKSCRTRAARPQQTVPRAFPAPAPLRAGLSSSTFSMTARR